MNCAHSFTLFSQIFSCFNPKNKRRRLHRHPAFFVSGTMEECLEDCCEVTGMQFYPLFVFDFLIELPETD